MAVTGRLLMIYIKIFTFKRKYFLIEVSKRQDFSRRGCWKQFFPKEKNFALFKVNTIGILIMICRIQVLHIFSFTQVYHPCISYSYAGLYITPVILSIVL